MDNMDNIPQITEEQVKTGIAYVNNCKAFLKNNLQCDDATAEWVIIHAITQLGWEGRIDYDDE
jgi:hypothetical protein